MKLMIRNLLYLFKRFKTVRRVKPLRLDNRFRRLPPDVMQVITR